MHIVSAITTCPRQGVSYLESTLQSLHDAGFEPEIVRDENMSGSWWALREALQRLLEREADAFVVFQDDLQIAKGCREWLETQLWPMPEENVGVVSLYCATPCHERPGWFTTDDLGVYRTWGALALCFPRHSAKRIVAHKERALLNGSDTTVAGLLRNWGMKWFLHSPSLVEHTGAISAVAPLEVGLTPQRVSGNWCRDVRELT